MAEMVNFVMYILPLPKKKKKKRKKKKAVISHGLELKPPAAPQPFMSCLLDTAGTIQMIGSEHERK